MPVVLPSIKEKSFHWSACLYASRLFLGTISLHLDLLMPLRAFMPQVGGTTASLEICVILIQPSKALPPISVILFGMVTEVSALHLMKALPPISVTLFGKVTEVNALQSSKAPFPIVVTLFGKVTEVSALQSAYLQPIITQYFIDNKSEIWLLFLIAHSKR